ncbi:MULTISPECIES: dihydrolipoamide acetyltransferase family protein [unclassified Arthrobacter]|uniref:dihydrolipoamide acetyltransferase family protein n=1 Tax=unclassified Arthrobacter TaxID=235627 RepID=UPI00149123FD|nr:MULTISPECIES: dihydrolipoamide acetyltransferase family protein [unclassified Arthrobacter]MBE0010430.1 2-oxo acid dehydrogenase subunit E2 [Arthrobacter sp. AET 35A]NOJ64246.1 2-oxo acid dehydrogenase subunit E2 [Arthrobacter sp. 147(2020)]
MTLNTFNLPDVGEGLTEAEIVRWVVQPGSVVAVNDIIVEIETAKSLVELSSPYAGVVAELLAAEGETIEVGTPIISVADGDGDVPAPQMPGELATPPASNPPTAADPRDSQEAPAAGPLVGTGPKADSVKRRPRRPASEPIVRPGRAPAAAPAAAGPPLRILAKPPVRKVARDLGIDLADVEGTGRSGEVTKRDLLGYQNQRDAGQDGANTFWDAPQKPQDQRIERLPVKGVRKATARAMVESAFSAPHVSIFVDVDASRTMEFVKRLKASPDFEGIKVSPLLILCKAVIWAAARNPAVNATWAGDEILVKHFMNLGIAAATPRGLMVPNIKDAQDLTLKELAVALNELATTARAGKTQPAQMQGGSLTVTNIGALGIDTGTPIINPGEVAIVAFGTIKQKPWVVDGVVVPRWITTLGGSFDHRVVDGDLSARFMADVASILEEPALLLD